LENGKSLFCKRLAWLGMTLAGSIFVEKTPKALAYGLNLALAPPFTQGKKWNV